ncbi:MAG TPA: DUF5694 domain-containing protein [Sphingomonas sp.]|nr:DUF5694 domain-containing protein [Sphingomonas sp.]
MKQERMVRGILASTAILGIAAAPPPKLLVDRPAAAAPELLVLGSPHLGNPARDIADPDVPNVLAPDRQKQIETIIDDLARFRPTHIAIEWEVSEQDKLDKAYADYLAGRRAARADEIDQIAFRLGKKLGLKRIDAADWFKEPPGKDSDYDFETWAKQHGEQARLDAITGRLKALSQRQTAAMRCTDVASWYDRVNTPAHRAEDNRAYFDFALLGDATANPGATWVGNWHARNLHIFANLVRIAKRPDDRVLVLFGAGHGFLLDRFARDSGAFRVVDTMRYLPAGQRLKKAGC